MQLGTQIFKHATWRQLKTHWQLTIGKEEEEQAKRVLCREQQPAGKTKLNCSYISILSCFSFALARFFQNLVVKLVIDSNNSYCCCYSFVFLVRLFVFLLHFSLQCEDIFYLKLSAAIDMHCCGCFFLFFCFCFVYWLRLAAIGFFYFFFGMQEIESHVNWQAEHGKLLWQ